MANQLTVTTSPRVRVQFKMHHKRAFTLCAVPGASIASRLEYYAMSHIHPVTTTTTATTDCIYGYRVSQLDAVAGALGICQWPKNESYAFLNETVFWVIYCHYVCGRFRVHITDCIVALNLPPT